MDKRFQLKKLFKHWHVVALLLAVYDMAAVTLPYFSMRFFSRDPLFTPIRMGT